MMKPGIYYDIPAATYFADPCDEPSLTQSIAKILITQSPAHAFFRHPRLNPAANVQDDEYSSAKAIGNAAHKLVLGRGKEVCVIEAKDFRTNEAKATRDKATADGYTPILAKHHKAAKELAAAIRDKLDAAGCERAFHHGHAEVVMIARDGDIWLRSMADWMDGFMIYDLKTGDTSAAPEAIPYRMADQGWDIQAAMQERILDLLYPAEAGRRKWRFVAVEQSEPFALTVNELPESVMTMGGKKLQYAIDRWRWCINHCVWPGYEPIIHRPEYPGFAEAQWLNREIKEAAAERQPFNPNVLLAG
jgi:PDDEXK-like domain of unknown function (DUF3799)